MLFKMLNLSKEIRLKWKYEYKNSLVGKMYEEIVSVLILRIEGVNKVFFKLMMLLLKYRVLIFRFFFRYYY